MSEDIKAKSLNIENLVDYQKDTVVSREVIKKELGTVTFFAFDKGQGLSEHSAPFDAMVQVIDGEAEITISGNKNIVKKLYEQLEKGNINIDILNYFEEQNIIDHISGIMSYDFEISDLNKCIEDVVNTYEKDKLINRRQEILDIIKNGQGFSEEELNNLEDELSNIVIKLKK